MPRASTGAHARLFVDTTIVLTQENQPVIILQEEHSPTSGKFEPVISWEPSQVIDTRQYFEQREDSLVIVARVTATNIAGMITTDSVKITLKKNVLDHFAVRVERDTVAFTETSKIFVQGKDARDNDIDPPADTKVNIVLRVDERYGNLAYKSTVGKEVIDVPYGDAQSGQVVFAATGENPIGLPPQKVDIGVTGLGKEGVGSVWVKCTINPPRYAQGGNSPWADDHYDNAYDDNGNEIKIRTLGCALSCMAMAMTAFGDTVNPGELNEWMKMAPKDSGGYRGRSVNWRAISLHSPSKKIYGADA
ncbi:MAG TPA: hypothetical protein VNL36_06170, partial [Bacteroidota bacterium]|nr:hypothetical protein [Bacteroidota bacterium]